MSILTITDLCKSFGEKKVLRGVSLSVPTGSIFGFVGRNGAGKTTAMKAILGLLKTDGGEITVDGKRVRFGETPTNRSVGYLPDVPEFYSFMTAREYLSLCGEALGMNRSDVCKQSDQLLSLVGLSGERHRIKGYSRGMKQRLGIAQALLGSPKLLICDEPTSALDPIGRKEILDILQSVKDRTTVLFSTHILSDVERICTDVAFLHDGVIAMQGSVSELKSLYPNEDILVETDTGEDCERLLARFSDAERIERDTLRVKGNGDTMRELLAFIAREQILIRRIERIEPSLESLFLEVAAK